MSDQLVDQSLETLTSKLDKPWFDASKINEFRSCPQKFYNRYVKGLTTEDTSYHLDFGIGIHKALEHFYLGTFFDEIEYNSPYSKSGKLLRGFVAFLECFPQHKEQGYKTRISGLELLAAYAKKYQNESFDILDVERSFLLDMDTFYYVGRMDLVIRENNRTMPQDHKTTSRFGPQFEQQFKIDTQITGYITAVRRLIDERCNSGVINALRVTKTIDINESFLRKMTSRAEWELEQWEYELRETANQIIELTKNPNGLWARDGQRCYDYNSPCPFYTLCLTHPNGRQAIEDANFKVEHWEPL